MNGPSLEKCAIASLVVLACVGPGLAAGEHPFILWTADEAAALRKLVETQPWARKLYESRPKGRDRNADGLPRLFAYSVMGDQAAGQAEKKLLLGGKGGHGRYIQGLRYDILHDLLTPAERKRVADGFRRDVRGGIARMKGHRHNRFNWLPNLGYPWYLALHLKAVATRDEKLCREIFASRGGLKWYLDEYLSDLGFYNEEFGKAYNTPDAILLWGRACKRMGLDEIGFGYKGRQGATIRGHIESFLRVGYPRVDLGTDRPSYPRMTMGDAKGSRGYPAYGFQHNNVDGWLTDRRTGRGFSRWTLGFDSWFELAHHEWPDAGFDYFLAQRRDPGETAYHPSLLFGNRPIDAKTVKPPPAPSGVYPGRGIVMLRADESPNYWESPAPAVGMRLATPYAHHIQDCFALTGFYAYNRPLFVNRQISTNYSGVDPGWSNSPRCHSTVMVDFAEPKTIGEVKTRHHFGNAAKFFSATGKGIYPGVTQMRSLMLTREYLLDVFALQSDRPRHYIWIVQGLGECPSTPQAWTPSQDLAASLYGVGKEQSLTTEATWSVTMTQSSGGAHPKYSGFGKRWFDQRIGVRTTVLGEPGTTAYTAWSPVVADASGQFHGRDRFAFGEDEPAAATLAAVRRKPATTFVAVHEPFRGRRQIRTIRRFPASNGAVAARVELGEGDQSMTDFSLVAPAGGGAVSAGDHDVKVVSRGHAYVRRTAGRIDLVGDVSGMVLRVGADKPKLFVDGVEAKATFGRETLLFGKMDPNRMRGEATFNMVRPAGYRSVAGASLLLALRGPVVEIDPVVVSARWLEGDALAVPLGESGTKALRLRNESVLGIDGTVNLTAAQGLVVSPSEIALSQFMPGGEMDVKVRVDAAKAPANRIGTVRVTLANRPRMTEIQPAPLTVANGMCKERVTVRQGDFHETIYSPRYVARYYYMDSAAAGMLLDPLGRRRFISAKTSYPNLLRTGTDSRGRTKTVSEKFRRFPYFVSVVCPGEGGEPPLIYDGGQRLHAHGTTGGLEHWFTEDWIVVRYREAKPGEEIAFNWHPTNRKSIGFSIAGRRQDLAEKLDPQKIQIATADAKCTEVKITGPGSRGIQWPGEVKGVRGVFRRPAGYEYGSAEFYPPGSRMGKGGVVYQPGDKPMGFTYCKEAEFAGLLGKWVRDTPTGVARDVERGRFGGAFMPHLEVAE